MRCFQCRASIFSRPRLNQLRHEPLALSHRREFPDQAARRFFHPLDSVFHLRQPGGHRRSTIIAPRPATKDHP